LKSLIFRKIINKINEILNIQILSITLVIYKFGYFNYKSEYLKNISRILSFRKLKKDIYPGYCRFN